MIYRNHWEIWLSKHAREQAWWRGITADMIEAALKTGEIEKLGKNRIIFKCKYKRGAIICVGERKSGNSISILTVEWGSK